MKNNQQILTKDIIETIESAGPTSKKKSLFFTIEFKGLNLISPYPSL